MDLKEIGIEDIDTYKQRIVTAGRDRDLPAIVAILKELEPIEDIISRTFLVGYAGAYIEMIVKARGWKGDIHGY